MRWEEKGWGLLGEAPYWSALVDHTNKHRGKAERQHSLSISIGALVFRLMRPTLPSLLWLRRGEWPKREGSPKDLPMLRQVLLTMLYQQPAPCQPHQRHNPCPCGCRQSG